MRYKVNGNIINITQPIITMKDSEEFINLLQNLENEKEITINVLNSFSFPSNIIGRLLKLKDNGIKININVKDNILYELFDDLNLTSIFNVKRI